MIRKVVAVWVSLLIIVSSIVILVKIAERVEAPTTLYVGGAGGGNYSKIQWAIDNASDGDTVFVYAGDYLENIAVGKRINLNGENRNTTVINGGGNGDVVRLGYGTKISGFTITNSGSNGGDVGIQLSSSNTIITNNIIINNFEGIRFIFASSNHIISNNTIDSYGHGIVGMASNTQIINNNISNNDKGVYLHSSSDFNLIANNYFYNNSDGVAPQESSNNIVRNNNFIDNHLGIYVTSSSNNNIIIGNTINGGNSGIWVRTSSNNNSIVSNKVRDHVVGIYISTSASNNSMICNDIQTNTWAGINIARYSDESIIIGNNISDSDRGIEISEYSNNSIIRNNFIISNSYGLYLSSSHNNTIFHNNLISNSNQAFDDTNDSNIWDNDYPSGGNYWSDFDEASEGAFDDYHGVAQNISGSDTVVDNGSMSGGGINPYEIDSDSIDYYPLIEPFGKYTFLSKGWNLISIPFIQSDTDLGNVLSSFVGSYDAAQWYDVNDLSDPWKHNNTKKQFYLNDLKNINHTMGFWIHITEPGGVLFEYPGTKPTSNQTIQLHPGWNMVGYPSLTSHNRTTGLNNLTFDTHVDAIQWFDASTKTWYFMGPDDNFVTGRGYWVHSKVDVEWEVPI